MEAETAPDLSRDGDSIRNARLALFPAFGSLRQRAARLRVPFVFASTMAGSRSPERAGGLSLDGEPDTRRNNPEISLWPPSPLITAIGIVAIAVGFIAGLTYYGAREFSGRAADTRASNEAMSFAGHGARLATGDAFQGYIQILRYGDDPVVKAKSSTPNDRTAALQQLLYLNINKFSSLTVADRTGIILATTDSSIASMKGSVTFSETRANLSPANSDIVLPEAGKHGYVEYTAPLVDADGTTWAILVGRADPAILWKETLLAAVDGSTNVIINSEGQFSAGVPDQLLRQPWHGIPLPNGAVRADIAGVDSICGLAPIGKDTQIDRGLNVASCLPASIIQAEQNDATSKQALITLASAILAVLVAGVALRAALRGHAPATAVRPFEVAPEHAPVPAVIVLEPEPPAAPASVEPQLPPPDIDALTLIDAYEQRNARLADRIREQIQARLLIAASQADEAYKLLNTDTELSAELHQTAMTQMESIRERELRAIGQELYPGLVRLGLGGALRAMSKDLAEIIEIRLDADPRTDSVGAGAGRSPLSPSLRLVLYRLALESVQALALAGGSTCSITLRRDRVRLTLTISGAIAAGETVQRARLEASAIAIDAYAGTFAIEERYDRVSFTATVPTPPIEEHPEPAESKDAGEAEDGSAPEPSAEEPTSEEASIDPALVTALDDVFASAEADLEEGDFEADEEGPSPIRVVSLSPDAAGAAPSMPSRGLSAALEGLQAELFGKLIVALDLGDGVDGLGETSRTGPALIEHVVRETLMTLRAAEAERSTVSVRRDGASLLLSISADAGTEPLDETRIAICAAPIEAAGGRFSFEFNDTVSVLATVPIAAAAPALTPDDDDAA